MFLRVSALLIVLIYLLAACAGMPNITPVRTALQVTAPSPTLVPPTTASTATDVPTAQPAAANEPLLTPAPAPRELAFGNSYFGVHYCTDGATPLTMNIVTPKEQTAPAPVLLHLKFQPEFIRPLVEKGFVVANVDWREPPEHKLPVGVQDVKCAIRYLRAHAAQYNLNPDKVGVFGCSRGGRMAAMVGVTDTTAEMEGDFGFPDESSRVQAVAMFDGIANFKTNYADAEDELNQVHGISSFDDPQVSRLSPVTYVTPDDPAFLLIASESDGFSAQAKEMQGALDAVGAPTTLIEAEGATHCNFASAGPHTLPAMIDRVGDFFKLRLTGP